MGIELFFFLYVGCSLIGLSAMDHAKSINSKRIVKSMRGNVQSSAPPKTRKMVDLLVINAINASNIDFLRSRRDFNVNGRDSQEKPLLLCAIASSVEVVRLLLERKADATVLYEGMSVLHSAAAKSDINIMKLLLSKEWTLDVDAGDRFGNTPLHYAAFRGLNEIVELLLTHGANILALNTNGSTPLHLAVAVGHVDTAGLLLINKSAINPEDNYGSTPLHRAAEIGKTEVVAMLILRGANINVVDCYGWTPLHFAAMRGHREIIAFLLLHGACVTAKNRSGQTAIALAKDTIQHIFNYFQKRESEQESVSIAPTNI